MTIAVLAEDAAKAEWLSKPISDDVEIIWADSVRSLAIIEADAYFDLAFDYDPERVAKMQILLPNPVLVNAVAWTSHDLRQPFVRINAWPTMLGRNVVELALPSLDVQPVVDAVFRQLDWEYLAVPDIVGMITPRILTMIINEAWFTLAAGTSTKEEIDIAMKLGTNYPFGPFEWSEKIGLSRIKELMRQLNKTDARYSVAPGLM